jgi:hypothetical protein
MLGHALAARDGVLCERASTSTWLLPSRGHRSSFKLPLIYPSRPRTKCRLSSTPSGQTRSDRSVSWLFLVSWCLVAALVWAQHKSILVHKFRHSAIPSNLTRLPSYKLRHLTAMDTRLVLPRFPIVKFRVLIIGRANAGKTTILQRVCDTTESPEIYRVDSSGARHRVRSRSL